MNNSLELGKKVIKDKIPLIPKNPGVYRMINFSGEILYIGKAKNIPNRLKSYTSDSNLPIRTERMLSLTHNLEIATGIPMGSHQAMGLLAHQACIPNETK